MPGVDHIACNDFFLIPKHFLAPIVFIYCGTVLENDTQTLDGYKVRANTMIQVFPKQHDLEYKSEPATNEQVNAAVTSYRGIFKELANSSVTVGANLQCISFEFEKYSLYCIINRICHFQKTIRPELMKQILEAYPEFHTNLGAYAILRDSILIQSMAEYDTAKTIAKQYPILIHSAQFVTKLLRENLTSNTPNLVQNVQPIEDSDSSSSESDSPTVSPNRSGDIRQISRDQLTQALLLAGSASTNSLSNIAQRNQSQTSTSSQQSTSSASAIAPATATAPSSASLISTSMFTNALSQALNAAGNTGPSPQSTAAQPNPAASANPNPLNLPASNENHAERYATELQTMREMGLFEELINIQALVVSNGDVEAAINLVLSGLGSFN